MFQIQVARFSNVSQIVASYTLMGTESSGHCKHTDSDSLGPDCSLRFCVSDVDLLKAFDVTELCVLPAPLVGHWSLRYTSPKIWGHGLIQPNTSCPREGKDGFSGSDKHSEPHFSGQGKRSRLLKNHAVSQPWAGIRVRARLSSPGKERRMI